MFQFTVNNKFSFELEKTASIDLTQLSTTSFHVLKDNKSYAIELIKTDFNSNNFELKVNGNRYEVVAKDELGQLLSNMGISTSTTSKVNELKTSMPGTIVAITIEVGQEVMEGDALLILEAMKMENVLKSPVDGTIKEIKVEKGMNVDKNAILIVFE